MKQIVYVASPESQQIHVWQLDDKGSLALLQTVEVAGQVQPMAIHPDNTHLYVGYARRLALSATVLRKMARCMRQGWHLCQAAQPIFPPICRDVICSPRLTAATVPASARLVMMA